MQRTLIKLGGSLLALPNVIERLSVVMDAEATVPVLLVGGGETADLVRQWDAKYSLGDERAHELALHAMVLNAHLLTALHNRCLLASSLAEVVAVSERGIVPVLDVARIIRAVEERLPESQHLKPSWDVTSDSIAAWITRHWNIQKLLLLKSAHLPAGGKTTLETTDPFRIAAQLVSAEIVDSAFAEHGPEVPQLCWCNLRESPELVERLW